MTSNLSVTAVRPNLYQEAMQTSLSMKQFMRQSIEDPVGTQLRVCEEAVADPVALVRSWMEFTSHSKFQEGMQEVEQMVRTSEKPPQISGTPNFDDRVIAILSSISADTLEKAGSVFDIVLAKATERDGAVVSLMTRVERNFNQDTMAQQLKIWLESLSPMVEKDWPRESVLLKGCKTPEEVVEKVIPHMIAEIRRRPVEADASRSFEAQNSRLGYVTSVVVAALVQLYGDKLHSIQ